MKLFDVPFKVAITHAVVFTVTSPAFAAVDHIGTFTLNALWEALAEAWSICSTSHYQATQDPALSASQVRNSIPFRSLPKQNLPYPRLPTKPRIRWTWQRERS